MQRFRRKSRRKRRKCKFTRRKTSTVTRTRGRCFHCRARKSGRTVKPRSRSTPSLTLHRKDERALSCSSLKSVPKDDLPYSLSMMPPMSVLNISDILLPLESRVVKRNALLSSSCDMEKGDQRDEKDDDRSIDIITLSPSNQSNSTTSSHKSANIAGSLTITGLHLRSWLRQKWSLRICLWISGQSLVSPWCPICNEDFMSWSHFFECFKLDRIPARELRNPEVWTEMARAYLRFRTANNHDNQAGWIWCTYSTKDGVEWRCILS